MAEDESSAGVDATDAIALRAVVFKWRREAELLRSRAADFRYVGDAYKSAVCEAKAGVIEDVLKDVLVAVERAG